MKILVASFGKHAATEFSNLLAEVRVSRTWTEDQNALFSFLANGTGHGVCRAVAGSGKSSTLREGLLRLQAQAVDVKTLHALGYAACPKGVRGDSSQEFWQASSSILACLPKAAADVQFWATRDGKAAPAAANLVATAASWIKNTNPLFVCDEEGMKAFVAAVWAAVGQRQAQIPERDEEACVRWLAGCAMHSCMASEKAARSGKAKKISFEDMIWLPVRLNAKPRQTYDLVLIDEAQDMCATQIKLAQMHLAPGGRLVAVGDEKQAMFGFRGADSTSISRLQEELNATELRLGLSFRCPLRVAEAAVRYNPEFKAFEGNARGEVFENFSPEEARKIAGPGDFVLCRLNAPLVRECLGMLKEGKPAFIRGKDLLADLTSLVKELAKSEFAGIPEVLERLNAWKASGEAVLNGRKMSPDNKEKALSLLEDKFGILEAVAEVSSCAGDMISRLQILFTERKGAVILGTIHGAKGLEATNVFILAEKFFKEGSEEDNIRYVALTRSKARLYLVGFSLPQGQDEGGTPLVCSAGQEEDEEGEEPAPVPCSAWLPKAKVPA